MYHFFIRRSFTTETSVDMLHSKGSVCTCHPVNYPSNTLQRLLTQGPESYSPHYAPIKMASSAPASTMFRKTNTEYHPYSQKHHHKSNTTLQNVLMGEIPSKYSHLSSSPSEYQRKSVSPSSHGHGSPPAPNSLRIPSYSHDMPASSPLAIPSQHARSPRHMASSPRQYGSPTLSVSPAHHMSPAHSMSPAHRMSPGYHMSPMHRMSPAHAPSPMSTASPHSTTSETCQEEPIDLSRTRKTTNSSDERDEYLSDSDSHKSDEGSSSLLRNLLSIGKQFQRQDLSDEESNCPEIVIGAISSTTKVTLAKKNMYPVSSRVSDWLVKIVQFAKGIPEFQSLSHNDKVTLILNSWTRLLVLFMAESNFHFAVTPSHNTPTTTSSSSQEDSGQTGPTPDEPTMKSVEGIQNFIRKCQTMNLDPKEYVFLRMAVLFNGGKFFFFLYNK